MRLTELMFSRVK